MDTIDKILFLIKDRGVTAAQVTREANITNGLITQWKQRKQKPSMDNLVKIANYFKVDIDYLLGDTDDPTPTDKKKAPSGPMSSKEALKEFLIKEGVLPADRDLTDEEVQTLRGLADAFFSKGKK